MTLEQQTLNHAIDEFLEEHDTATVLSVNRVVDPLLELWSLANTIGAEVATPLEQLLTALMARSIITPAELRGVLSDVRTRAADQPAGATV